MCSFLLLDSDSDLHSCDDFDEPQRLRIGRPCAPYNAEMYISAASGIAERSGLDARRLDAANVLEDGSRRTRKQVRKIEPEGEQFEKRA